MQYDESNTGLYPGDIVELWYWIRDSDSPYLDDAINQIKDNVRGDSRFHYQSSRVENRTEARYFIVVVSIADPAKVVRQPGESEMVQVGIPVVAKVVLWLATLLTAAYGIHTYGEVMRLRLLSVNGIVYDPNVNDDLKIAACKAIAARGGFGETLGGLGVLLIVALLAYLVFGGHR